MRLAITILMGLAVLLLAAVFGSLNDQVITVNLLLASYPLRLAYVLMAAFVFGCLAGLLLASGSWLRMRIEVRRMRAELAVKDRELTELRTLPARDSR